MILFAVRLPRALVKRLRIAAATHEMTAQELVAAAITRHLQTLKAKGEGR